MQSNGLATMMLLIPVLTVPALAIFGIPQFAPVVASPLDEGQEKGKESRVGNSARQQHDDLFGDVDEITSEFGAQDSLPSHRRDSVGAANGSRQSPSRRSSKGSRTGWSDDLEEDSDWASKLTRRSSSDAGEIQEPPRSTSARNSKRSAIPERTSRDSRQEFDGIRVNNPIRVASAAEADQKVMAAAFVDEQEVAQDSPRGNRTRMKDTRAAKRRESANEQLTWQRAVERLNAMDIRDFRLEPGHQAGQFVFICSYTPPENSRVSYRFEAGADEPLKAVEKVLEQIVEWQQGR